MRYTEIMMEARPSILDLPVRSFDALYHVGKMKIEIRNAVNLEGDGLSVSLHPNVWRKIDAGWISGDLWRLTKQGNKFLDFLALSDDQRNKIVDWATQEGYGRRDSHGGIWGERKLWAEFRLVPHQTQAFDFLVMIYLRNHGELDGIWWNEKLNPVAHRKGGWAPRGTIFRQHLADWKIEKIEEGEAPDLDLLPDNFSVYVGGKNYRGLDKRPKATLEKLLQLAQTQLNQANSDASPDYLSMLRRNVSILKTVIQRQSQNPPSVAPAADSV